MFAFVFLSLIFCLHAFLLSSNDFPDLVPPSPLQSGELRLHFAFDPVMLFARCLPPQRPFPSGEERHRFVSFLVESLLYSHSPALLSPMERRSTSSVATFSSISINTSVDFASEDHARAVFTSFIRSCIVTRPEWVGSRTGFVSQVENENSLRASL